MNLFNNIFRTQGQPRERNQEKRSNSYCKTVVPLRASSAIKNSITKNVTNANYYLTGGLQKAGRYFSSNTKQESQIYIHGNKFANEKQAQMYLKKVIWFSYREIPGISQTYDSDAGWGCLIRVGQMAMAAGLKKYLQCKKSSSQTMISNNIIFSFFDQNDNKKYDKYSLKRIVSLGKSQYDLNYGDWFTPNQICSLLVSLHKCNPLKETEGLKAIYQPDSTLVINEILEKMGAKPCTCIKRRVLCQQCHPNAPRKTPSHIETFTYINNQPSRSNIGRTVQQYSIQSSQNHVLLFINCRLGINSVGQKQYAQLQILLKSKYSLGAVGGIPNKGLYMVGTYKDQVMYLDPHKVQPEVNFSNYNKMSRTFATEEIRTVARTGIDPSMAFVFYLSSLEDLEGLKKELEGLKKNYHNYILSWMWEGDHEVKDEEKVIVEAQNEMDEDNSFID